MDKFILEPVEKKLFYGQYEDLSQIAFETDKEYKSLEIELTEIFDMITDFMKAKIAVEDTQKFEELMMKYQLSQGAHEQYANYLFYKLGLNDGIQIKTRCCKDGAI